MNKPNYHLYFGRAGHLKVMSEFLLRGWNVAVPEVDEGDDIFVVQHETGELKRVQVKTAKAKSQKESYATQFNLSLKQLADIKKGVHYVFLVRHLDKWSDILIITQETLFDLYNNRQIGSVHKDSLTLWLTFRNDKVASKKTDFTYYQNNFEDFIITKP